MNALMENDTWELTNLPEDRKETKGRWVYTLKQGASNDVKFKARYVAKGYSQVQGLDYDETFSPTTRFTTIRALVQMAANDGHYLHQMDDKGAYLNAPIDKDIYVQQPPGYELIGGKGEKLSCYLKKSLYGLKQSGRNWHTMLTEFLKSEGFKPSITDPCVYTRENKSSDDRLIIVFWVDDIIIACSNLEMIEEMKQDLNKRFNMDDRGQLQWFLGIDFKKLRDGKFLMSQERYTS